uniref:Uncharacterized protein n=1 Tax=viral metagenome TaxID=1070528 RepID=A0A6C0KMM8_9ZZZZ
MCKKIYLFNFFLYIYKIQNTKYKIINKII